MFDTTNMSAKEVKARVDQINAALAPEKTYLANPVDPKTLLDASTEKSRMGQAIAKGWFFNVARQEVELMTFTPQRLTRTSVKLNAAGPIFHDEYAALCALHNATVLDNKRRLAIVDARIKKIYAAEVIPNEAQPLSTEPLLGKAHTTEQVAAPVVVEKQTAAEYVTALSESVAAEKASDELLAEAKKKAAAGKKAAAARKAAASKKAPIKKNTSKKAST